MTALRAFRVVGGVGLLTSGLLFAACSKPAERMTDKPIDPAAPQAAAPQASAPMDQEAAGKRPELTTTAPRTDTPRMDAPMTDARTMDAPMTDAPMTDAPRSDAPRMDAMSGSEPRLIVDTAPNKARRVDNSGQNEVDRNGASLTPFDQGNSEADLSVTQAIRKSLIADSSLSTNAQNLKIITRDGVVVLRGPVANRVEFDAVLAHVRTINGITRVENQIAVP